jgi:hypothetical protein
MKTLAASSAVAAAVVLAWSGCSRGPRHIDPPRIDASEAGRRAVAQYDTKKAGKIGGADLDACPAVKSIVDQLDPGGEGGVTAETIAARIRQWQDLSAARLIVTFRILHHGRPLPGAVVTLVPEEFLGPDMKPGSGTTTGDGITVPSIPTGGGDDFAGMPCGFYRVEITKPGESIPAAYNTATVLGVEISIDKKRPQPLQFEFDLKY